MSTLKPNKLEVLKKQFKEQEEIVDLLPKEINKEESHLYHVVMVESKPNNITKKFEFKVTHKKYNEKSFDVNKEQFPNLGYTDVHILHDPRVKKKTTSSTNGNSVTSSN